MKAFYIKYDYRGGWGYHDEDIGVVVAESKQRAIEIFIDNRNKQGSNLINDEKWFDVVEIDTTKEHDYIDQIY
jgi:hypothetical protein